MTKKLTLVSSNKHKFEEIGKVLAAHGIELAWKNAALSEPDLDTLEEVATAKARQAVERVKGPCIVEDTGVFFDAYNSFPGTYAKRVYLMLGYKGLLKLLEGEPREGSFRTCIAYTEPGKEPPKVVCGEWKGVFIEEIKDKEKDVLPYERFFVPEGFAVTMSALSREKKNRHSHRGKAAKKLAALLNKR